MHWPPEPFGAPALSNLPARLGMIPKRSRRIWNAWSSGRSRAFEAAPQLDAKCANKRFSRSASANLQTVLKSCGLVKSNDATGNFSTLLGFLSTANTLKPRFLHALLNRQDPAKISRIKPEPLLGSSSVPKDSSEAFGAKTVELQKESHALTIGSLQKGLHALAAVPDER